MLIFPLKIVIFPLKIEIFSLKIVILPLKIVIFHSYVNVYQRVIMNNRLKLTCAKRREFSGIIHWLTINNHPTNPSNLSIPYV